jgi:hypothetical protein
VVWHKVSQSILSPKQSLNQILSFALLKFGKKGERSRVVGELKLIFVGVHHDHGFITGPQPGRAPGGRGGVAMVDDSSW